MTQGDVIARQLCRQCINVRTGARLRRRDCKYWHYPTPCAGCGQVRNIVTGVTLTGRWKLFWSKIMN